MSDAIITSSRPKAEDPTGAQRQARFRKKRKGVVTVAKSAVAADAPSPAPAAHPTVPPPLVERVTGMPVVAPRNGDAGITVATLGGLAAFGRDAALTQLAADRMTVGSSFILVRTGPAARSQVWIRSSPVRSSPNGSPLR